MFSDTLTSEWAVYFYRVKAAHTLAGLGARHLMIIHDPVSSPASERRALYLEVLTNLRSWLDEALPALGRTQPAYEGLDEVRHESE